MGKTVMRKGVKNVSYKVQVKAVFRWGMTGTSKAEVLSFHVSNVACEEVKRAFLSMIGAFWPMK
ncbi:hypothetical protein BWI97_21295 [Siphonobacter sp. BAB-5405]|nr:hypothetical protein BWI97_21295 [Siphonobacter sp. BAB-5405]